MEHQGQLSCCLRCAAIQIVRVDRQRHRNVDATRRHQKPRVFHQGGPRDLMESRVFMAAGRASDCQDRRLQVLNLSWPAHEQDVTRQRMPTGASSLDAAGRNAAPKGDPPSCW